MVQVVEIVDNDYPTSVYDSNLKAVKVRVSGFATSHLIIEYELNKRIINIIPTDRIGSFVTLSFYDADSLKHDLQKFINGL